MAGGQFGQAVEYRTRLAGATWDGDQFANCIDQAFPLHGASQAFECSRCWLHDVLILADR